MEGNAEKMMSLTNYEAQVSRFCRPLVRAIVRRLSTFEAGEIGLKSN